LRVFLPLAVVLKLLHPLAKCLLSTYALVVNISAYRRVIAIGVGRVWGSWLTATSSRQGIRACLACHRSAARLRRVLARQSSRLGIRCRLHRAASSHRGIRASAA